MQPETAIDETDEVARGLLHQGSVAPVHPLPRSYLPRAWMSRRLVTDAPVTLVLGPAGIGKTVAVAGWANESDDPVAWVTVTAGGGRPTSLWHTIDQAVCTLMDVEHVTLSVDEPIPQGDAVLRLVARLDSMLERNVVLVIDDYHVVEDDDLAASMELFLRCLPARLRVVIVSRRVPQLPLDRMRVSGDLCELDVDDLRFSRSDADALLAMLVPDIDQIVADAIVSASDGWAAGLRLGALAWSSRPPEISAIHSSIDRFHDWVVKEVLGGESKSLVCFLSDVAATDWTTIALSQAITGRADAGELLTLARDRGLFVSRVGFRGDYEIHPAVRRALLAEREQRDPARQRRCHERAATWLEESDETTAALEQWLRAGHQGEALRLLAERHTQLYDSGMEHAVGEFLAQLGPEATAKDVRSLLDLAWCQLVLDVSAFRENVEQAVWWSEHGGDVDAEVSRRLRALQALACLSKGDWHRAERDARAGLAGYESWYDDPVIRTSWNDIARAIALSERWDDTSDEVREITVVLRKDPSRTVVLETTRALGSALSGRPTDAIRISHNTRSSTEFDKLTMSSAELALADVIAHREFGDASDAESDLERLINVDVGPLSYIHGFAAAELTQLHIDHGALSHATRAFCQLEAIVAEEMPGPGGQTLLGRIGTVLSIETGDRDQAMRWADIVDDTFWGPVSRARALAPTSSDEVQSALDGAVPRCPRHIVIHTMLKAGSAADREAASNWVDAAVQVARSNSMLQTLASADQIELLERNAWRLPGDWMDQLRRAGAAVQPELDVRVALVEPLTVRERDVLRFLPSRLTLKEIAAELYVSVNTLKFHLKVIYRKLGVNSRAEAAEIARSWGRVDHR